MPSNKKPENRKKRTAKQPVDVERRQIEEAAARARLASESAVDEMEMEPNAQEVRDGFESIESGPSGKSRVVNKESMSFMTDYQLGSYWYSVINSMTRRELNTLFRRKMTPYDVLQQILVDHPTKSVIDVDGMDEQQMDMIMQALQEKLSSLRAAKLSAASQPVTQSSPTMETLQEVEEQTVEVTTAHVPDSTCVTEDIATCSGPPEADALETDVTEQILDDSDLGLGHSDLEEDEDIEPTSPTELSPPPESRPSKEELIKEHGHANIAWPSFPGQDDDSLFGEWTAINADALELAEKHDQGSHGRAAYLNARLPLSMLSSWSDCIEHFLVWEKTSCVVDAGDVVTLEDLARFFEQPKVPSSCVAILMQYDGGNRNDPLQWPRLTSRTILDVFKRLKNADTPKVQGEILSWLAATEPEYQLWVDIQWQRFDFRRKGERLPDVPIDQRGFLHVEQDTWDRGTPFTTVKSPVKSVKSVTAVTKALPPAQKPAQTAVDKRPFSKVVEGNPSNDKGGPPGEQRGTRPRAACGPSVERLMQVCRGGNIDAKLLRDAMDMDEAMEKLSGVRSSMCGNSGTLKRKAVSFPDVLVTPPRVASNDVMEALQTRPNTETEKLIEELNRISQRITALAGSDMQLPVANETIYVDAQASPVSLPNSERSRRRRSRRSCSSSDSESESGSRSKSKSRKTIRRTASEERKYSESAFIVDQECPLPVNKTQEAASDYLLFDTPLMLSSTCKSFMLNCKPYVENGDVTWEQWTFHVRTKSKSLNLSYDQTWRLATMLLPLNLQGIVYKEVMKCDFVGFCWATWKQIAGKAAEKMEPIALAIKELQALKFNRFEPVSEFVHRFMLVATRSMAPSCSMAQSLRPSQVFTYLNEKFSAKNGNNPGWLITPWNIKYIKVHNHTRIQCMALTSTGAALSDKAKDDIVDKAIETMCDWAVVTATTREDTLAELSSLQSLSSASQPTPRNAGASIINVTTENDRGRGRGSRSGRGRTNAGRGSFINAVTDSPNCAERTNGQDSQVTQGRSFAHEGQVGQGRVHTFKGQYGKSIQPLPPYHPSWASLPQMPEGVGKTTAQGQALAEYNLCTFAEANKGFEGSYCAACKKPYLECKAIYACTAVPDDMKDIVSKRSLYVNIFRSNRACVKRKEAAASAAAKASQ